MLPEQQRTIPRLERKYPFLAIILPPFLSKYVKDYPAKVKDCN
jgi:hypothetical protein